MKTLLFIIVFIGFIEFIQYWQIIKLLILNPFRKSKHILCSVKDVPKSMQSQLVAGIKELKTLGFKVSHFIRHQEFYASINSPKYAVILYHPEHNCYVELENNMNPDAIRPFKTVFKVYYQDLVLMGYYAEAYSIVDGYQEFHCFDNNEIDLTDRLPLFLEDVERKEKQMNLGERLVLDKHQTTQISNNLAAGYIDFLLEEQYVYEKNNAYFFKFIPSLKLAFKLKKKMTQITSFEQKQKNLLTHYPKYIKVPEVDAYLRHEKILNHPTFNKWIKTILFLVSAGLFVLLFGSTFDYTFALFLLPVLIFHELGHLLAMKIFGYNDLQVLFMPFGAAAMGKEKVNTSVLKKVIIYLAGPLPGIVLALALTMFPSVFDYQWITSLVIVLVLINYFNLLPFMPLDGGQIINQVLFGRYPILQFIFSLVSVIVFVMVAYYSQDYILGGFAFFLTIGLIGQFGNIKILRILSKEKYKNKPQLVAKIFAQLEKKPLRFSSKHEKVRTLVPKLMQPKAKLYEIILGLLLYFAAFFGPLYIVNEHLGGLLSMVYQSSISEDEFNDEKWTPDYWKNEVGKQNTAKQKFDVYIQMINFVKSNFSPLFKPLLKDALTIAKQNNFIRDEHYPKLLKANILINWSEFTGIDVDESLLNELSQIDDGNTIEYANTLLSSYMYGYKDNAIENLLKAQEIFKRHNQQDSNYMILNNLAQAHEEIENYAKAERYYTEIAHLQNNQYDSTQLIEFYKRREQYDKSLKLCEEMLTKLEKEPGQMASFYQKNCAWIALLGKHYQKAEKYFIQSYEKEKEQFQQLSYDIDETLNTLAFQHHKNMMVLEWNKGNTGKAKKHLQELEKLRDEDKYRDIEKTINALKENPNNLFSKPDAQTKLIIDAYEGLKQKE